MNVKNTLSYDIKTYNLFAFWKVKTIFSDRNAKNFLKRM